MPDQRQADTTGRFAIYAKNWKGNWYIPFLSIAFFILTAGYNGSTLITVISAFCAMSLGVALIEPVSGLIKNSSIPVRIFCLISSLGILLGCRNHIYELGWEFILRGDLTGILLLFLLIIAAVASFIFLFICTSYLVIKVLSAIREYGLFSGIERMEWIIYIVLIAAAACYVTAVFLGSRAFYGTDYRVDLVYTGDSQNLFNGNAYLNNWHLENDLRQPLFAVFASPFIGPVYLIGKILPFPPVFQALLLDYSQIAMLFVSALMLTRIMDLDRNSRISFILLFHSTYTFLLFSIMLEQYVTAFFWLVLSIYGLSCRKKAEKPVLFGACGTLLTSAALAPFAIGFPEKGKISRWILGMLCFGLEFILLMLSFGKITLFTAFFDNVSVLNDYAGNKVGILDRVFQFSAFIKGFFAVPSAGITTVCNNGQEYISWQLLPVSGPDIAGIVIFCVSIISLVINRDKICSRIAGYWILFSMIVLVAAGWGTQENGLILYALYFGWPYMMLLFLLIEWISDRIKIRRFLPAVCILIGAVLFVINIPEIVRLCDYMFSYYPA